MLRLNLQAAERFVASYPDANWNGWAIELFKRDPRGFSRRDGAFRRGAWGTLRKIEPNADGLFVFRV